MSVPEYLRDKNVRKFKVVSAAIDFKVHTIKIMSNPKIFNPIYSEFHNEIIKYVNNIYAYIWSANCIYVNNNVYRWLQRKEYQKKAQMFIQLLLPQLYIVKRLNHLRSRKYENWLAMLITVDTLLSSWIKTDTQRYGSLEKSI